MSALLVAQPACATGASLQELRQDTLCRLAPHVTRLDLLPQGREGLTLRIVDEDISAVERRLRTELPPDTPTGFQRIQIEAPTPTLAVVIDDLGLHPGPLTTFWELGQPLTYAILPESPHDASHLGWLEARHAAVLVHIPLEPMEPEMMTFEGFLTLAQPPRAWEAQLKRSLASVPSAIGWSNHMGSRFTADADAVRRLVLSTPSDLLILDSRTTVDSQLEAAARELRHPVAVRQVFLDNVPEISAIAGQLQEALSIAKEQGHVVAIGHPYPETARALQMFLEAHGDEVHLVTVDKISQPPTVTPALSRCPTPD